MDVEKLKDLDVAGFVGTYGKYDSDDLKEKLSSYTRAVLVQFADALLNQVNAALQQLQDCLPEEGEQFDEAKTEPLEAALAALRLAALLCADTLHECHPNPPEGLCSAAITLHDHALLELGDARPDVQDAVAKLCCIWWQYGAENREFLVSQTLPFLLLRAISTGKAAHVKACHAMRAALELLDFEDASINDMKRMLLQAAICPAFVSRPEGRKFLACLLTVHPSMVQEMTSVIRNQIPAGRRSVLDAYGEVILRGWREAVGPCLAEIETNLIQNLMNAALHGSGQALVASIRRVLGELHRSKRLGGAGSVDAMLVRLYEPILFRALSAANAGVRRNALQLLLDAFPLLDPEASTEEQDELLVRQFQALSDGLTDGCPSVRVVAAQGICGVLNLYWEIIPSATTAGFVSRLTSQLAFDVAMPAVRVAALEGLQLLVDNQHAQPVLSKALPQLAPVMWDPSPRVREAMADLLLCISTSRGLHFWEVVPLEVLLEQLVGAGAAGPGSSSVAQKLHQLLVPSYFPNPQEGAARIAALLKENRGAGQSFCRMLVAPFIHFMDSGKGSHQVQVPLEDILQLASCLMSHLLQHPPVADPRSPPRKQRNRRRTGGGRGAAIAEAAEDAAGAPGTAAGCGTRGKRKKALATAAGAGSSAAAAAAPGDLEEQDEEQEVDVMAVGVQEESVDSWQALLAGLAEICAGVGMALQHELCDEQDVHGLFSESSLQQLLAACPGAAAERCVWRVAEALPCLAAARQLLLSRMQLLGSGQLLPEGLDAAAAAAAAVFGAGSAAGSQAGMAADAAAVLACLAAGTTGPKAAAMLCAALGLEWPGCNSTSKPAGTAAAAADAVTAGSGDVESIRCRCCGQSEPEDCLLLCDGCDAGYHTSCLVPQLSCVPEGDWFCPGCCSDVKACSLGRGAAVACISWLLLSDSGRQLLATQGLLQRALPLVQQEAAAAAATVQAAFGSVAAAGQGDEAVVDGLVAALRLAALHARAGMHVLAASIEEQPAALAEGAVSILQQLASCCHLLRQLPKAAAASHAVAESRQLVGCIQQLLGLLKDVWCALRLLGGAHGQAAQAGVAADAAATAAECGCSLLAGLVAVSAAVEDEGGEASALQGALVANTQLLRALMTSPSSPAVQQRLSAWLLLWLEALATSPLAAAGIALKQDLPVLLSALLGDQQAGGRAAAGMRNVSVVSGAGGLQAEQWLPLLAAAAAQADEADAAEGEEGSQQQQQQLQQQESEDEAADAENRNPNTAAAAQPLVAAVKSKIGTTRAAAACLPAGVHLPPLLHAFVSAAARQKQEPVLAGRCVQLSISSAKQADWRACLGGLRLGRLLGCSPAGEQLEALKEMKAAALQDNGTDALLAAEQVDRVLGKVSS
ncbi:condensin II non structural maintenance of chromosomes subunit-domain-containing protein [Scenedesmus sp. NREL 46B-D3]|nr:condensin II non structural maintenance of chromosomes subunit-domain-containing protein [Scenedesmus sp. NREL 46B-D3]